MGHLLKTCPLTNATYPYRPPVKKRQNFGKVGLKMGLAG